MKLSQKAEQLLETSKTLFYKYGIKKVTVEEICKTADVSKMTFYKYFKNKDALVEYIVDQLYDDGMEKFHYTFSKNIPFDQKLKEWIDIKMAYSRLMSKEFYLDLIHFNQGIYEKILSKTHGAQKEMIRQVNEARGNGEIRLNVDTAFFSYMINHLTTLLDDPNFTSLYGNLESMTNEMAQFFLYGIIGRKQDSD